MVPLLLMVILLADRRAAEALLNANNHGFQW